MTASLSLASAALAAPASNGWKSQVVADASPQAVVKLNPTGRTYEIEVPLKVDGARLGDVGIEITADDKLSVDAKLLKTYLGKICRPEVLTAALAVPEEQTVQVAGGSVVSKKAPGTPSSNVQLVSRQLESKGPAQLGGEKPSYLSIATLKERGINMRYDPLNLELEVFPTVDQRPTSTISLPTAPGALAAASRADLHSSRRMKACRAVRSWLEEQRRLSLKPIGSDRPWRRAPAPTDRPV